MKASKQMNRKQKEDALCKEETKPIRYLMIVLLGKDFNFIKDQRAKGRSIKKYRK